MKSFNFSVFKTPVAIVSIVLAAIGLIANIISLLLPDVAAGLQDVFLLADGLAIIGILIIFFNVVEGSNYFGGDRLRVMGITIGLLVSLFFILTDRYLKIFEPIEEFAVDVRFRLSAGQLREVETAQGNIIYEPNQKAHRAIHIIGIDNSSVDRYQGFPFTWDKYASLLSALDGSTLNTVMFDIFFVDSVKNKNNILSGAMENLDKVVVDYAWETNRADEAVLNDPVYRNRLEQLEKFQIPENNIVRNEFLEAPEWVSYPSPPVEAIGKAVYGLGGANVKYSEGGTNYKMPMVFKWKNRLFPSISLIMACRFYGVDIAKDVKVELGKYVTIENIPERQVQIGAAGEPQDVMTKPNPFRKIRIPIDSEGLMDINFIGGAFSFPHTPIAEIIETNKEFPGAYGKDNPDFFRDQILLVAMYYATGVAKDIHPGPFGNVAGIEHHANALNTILNQNFIHIAPPWVNSLIYLFVGLVMGAIVPRFKMVFSLIAAVVLSILFLVEVFFLFNVFNVLHVFLTPYIELLVILISVVAYRALTEEENVKYIRSTFSRFVAKDVVNQLLANPENLKLGGEKKEITVFFSDVRGFTTISENLSPEELVAVLNDYLSVMTEIVIEYRGTVDKYMGDAIMAFWGAPVPEEQHAYFACICALKQLSELKKLQKKWLEQGWPEIDIGVGLNTGSAVVGNMGSSHRMDYTVMGDTVNLGSRLEGTTKVYSIRCIISEFTYAKVHDKVITRELDLIRVKGKNEPVRIYELLGLIDDNDFEKYRVPNA